MPVRPQRALLATSLLVALGAFVVTVAAQSPSPGATCTPAVPPAADPGAEPADLTVFAASSLTDAFEGIAGLWSAAHPGSDLVLSFDASSALRAQIEEGAPADAFASADERDPQALVDACLAPGPITPFAHNELVIVVPDGDPAGIESPADLAKEGVRIVAALPEVPITRYATQAIANLGQLEGDADSYIEAVSANTISEEENVRAVLTKIELGEGDAAIVYVTDALSSDAVETIGIPAEANVRASYAAVTVGASDQPALAAEFLAFLVGPDAQAVLASHGFVPAAPPPSATGPPDRSGRP